MSQRENARQSRSGQTTAAGTNSYCFFVAVWGETYIRTFLDCSLPSQFADGNLPALAARDVTYLIYTRPDDVETIARDPAIRTLEGYATVEIRAFTDEDLKKDGWFPEGYVGNLMRMTWCTEHALRSLQGSDTAYFFLNPDSVWANGAFKHADDLQRRGIRAAMALGFITIRPHVVSALEAFTRPDRPGVIDIQPRELVRVAIDCLHPLAISRLVTQDGNRFRSAFYWPVGTEGFVTRSFILHPIFTRPRVSLDPLNCTVDYRFVQQAGIRPDEVAIITDSDDLFYIDLAAAEHVPNSYPLTPYSRSSQLEWAVECADSWHREMYATTTIFVHKGPIHPKWMDVAEQADRFFRELLSEMQSHTSHLKLRLTNLPERHQPDATLRSPSSPVPLPPRPRWIRAVRRLGRFVGNCLFAPRRTVRNLTRRAYRKLLNPLYVRVERSEAHNAALQHRLTMLEHHFGKIAAMASTVHDCLGLTLDAPPDQLKPYLMMLEYELKRRLVQIETDLNGQGNPIGPESDRSTLKCFHDDSDRVPRERLAQ